MSRPRAPQPAWRVSAERESSLRGGEVQPSIRQFESARPDHYIQEKRERFCSRFSFSAEISSHRRVGVISTAQMAIGRMYIPARKFPVMSHASGVRNQYPLSS